MTAAPPPQFNWTDAAVREALGVDPANSAEPRPDAEVRYGGVSTDTRSLRPGDLFVALVGERFDAHDLLAEAASSGAAGVVVSRVPKNETFSARVPAVYLVADTLVALGALARFRRRSLPARVVSITGSSGKTTVKEILAAVLSGSFRTHATRGNLNNRVGVPLSLLDAPQDAEFLVIELGTSEPGEIDTLAAIAEPDHAIVTTVGEAHLSGLGSFEGVLDEKLDLVRGASLQGVAIVGDEPWDLAVAAREIRSDIHVAGFSDRADPDCRGELIGLEANGCFRVRIGGHETTAGIPGRHGAQNLVLALSMSRMLGAGDSDAIHRASGVHAGSLRGEMRRIGELTLFLDCYNANPQSMVAALELLAELPDSNFRAAVLGSMLELGNRSDALHREVLETALTLPIDVVVATGEFERAARAIDGKPDRLVPASGIDEGYEALRHLLQGGAVVLLKGSRGVRLERLVERFEVDFGDGAEG